MCGRGNGVGGAAVTTTQAIAQLAQRWPDRRVIISLSTWYKRATREHGQAWCVTVCGDTTFGTVLGSGTTVDQAVADALNDVARMEVSIARQ